MYYVEISDTTIHQTNRMPIYSKASEVETRCIILTFVSREVLCIIRLLARRNVSYYIRLAARGSGRDF